MGKSLLAIAVAIFAGFVGYKVLEKKNPALLKKVKKSVADAGQNVCDVVTEAKQSFYEGYANG
ncbi:MAG: hypothetical protein HQL30_12665 [Candidatus Omnitrophica bacterium]|nr:hypothetical protein [Candidatus Omnitrophota bacterium]